ncbi:hypothetical protein GUJ14_03010 [Enterococcus hirae]|uniref:hypothetical protein n=1 Tax=Enterococcus hirae TaxID=1354 RepID=UPI0006B1F495|nr:hypothetical protein [Enterococcus hirae]ASV82000.1 hypothetical protein A6J73_07770 [Enterococcus hirae]MBE8786489.1 hypothetical protein [Enterococcus hirae]MBE8804995.1 hypothetical protein [Enterococcus hirae]MBO1087662.1 hypothetical protein [Enterococcus hirae]MDD9145325.1 hypothetical protein [Enterococcus hirae]
MAINLSSIFNLLKEILTTVKELKTISLTDRKNFQLEYVTSERANWRIMIRETLQELLRIKMDTFSSDDQERYAYRRCLIRLQPLINPYGETEEEDSDSYYIKDGHIKKIIDNDDLNDIDKLITFLSYLLKFDWERSKYEATSIEIDDDITQPTKELSKPEAQYIEMIRKYNKK